MDQLSLPPMHRSGNYRGEEAAMCDQIEAELTGQGLRIEREYPTKSGRVDMAVLHPTGNYPVELIEAKVFKPLWGLGQLLGYQYGLTFAPKLTLVVSSALSGIPELAFACETAGVRLWEYETPERQQRRERFATRKPIEVATTPADRDWEGNLAAIRAQLKARRSAR